jgi:DEAD/DEAH box helicase domain-containing protein
MGAALLALRAPSLYLAASWPRALLFSALVASATPLDQYLASHPEYFFDKSPEQGLLNPDNLLILLGHMRCAAFELPFQNGEGFGNLPPAQVQEFLEFLVQEGTLHHSSSKYFWMSDGYPAQGLAAQRPADTVTLQAEAKVGDNDWKRGYSSAPISFTQAPFICTKVRFTSEDHDLENHLAHLRHGRDYYTQPGGRQRFH